MLNRLSRRDALRQMTAAAAQAAVICTGIPAPAATADALSDLEREEGGRLGVAVLDVRTGATITHRADERFAMCSTFKLLAAACVLARVDRGQERLNRRIVFRSSDLVPYSPATASRVGGDGMSLAELCEGAMTLSDNTAGNLLLSSFGGPGAFTAYARSLGDPVTRLDRREVDLNEARRGDPRDTTTPSAMLKNVRRLVLGDALSAESRERLIGWLVANKTGDARLRAGFPGSWRVGDKTGAGDNGTTNDVAVGWRSDGAPMIVSAYYTESALPPEGRDAVLAAVGRFAAAAWRTP